ncbi:hypothetical protein EMMF5_000258 [Cystobasidiomycetes sp. EMM_F5]
MSSSSAVSHNVFSSHETGSALIYGSSGAVGRQLMYSLLTQSNYSRVIEIGRRATSYPLHGVTTPSVTHLAKQKSIVVPTEDFGDTAKLRNYLSQKSSSASGTLPTNDWSAVYITLGTTRANAGGAAAFEKIDREYVLNAAQSARIPELSQTVIYCSSQMADPTSSMLYTRSKGLTEQGLASMGYDKCIIFRPGYLRVKDGRDKPRWVETFYGGITRQMQRFYAGMEIETDVLARAMLRAGEMGIEQCINRGIGAKAKIGKDGEEALVINNAAAIKLANLQL